MATNSKIQKVQEEELHKDSESMSMEDYFMNLAFLTGKRSKDPKTQVGACIVNKQNQVVSTGFNDMPNGCTGTWQKRIKLLYVCHAEMNAIMNKNTLDIHGCSLYVSLFPCNECVKLIIQSGIAQVFYYSDKYYKKETTQIAKKMLSEAKISYRQYRPKDVVLQLRGYDQLML